MSDEWSYSDEELNEYFQDASQRRTDDDDPTASSDAASSNPLRRFFEQRLDHPDKVQAAYVLSILVGIALLGVLTLGVYMISLSGNLPSTQSLENPQFQLATIAYTADGEELARYARQNRSWINYRQISPHTIDALVATEDHRFRQHWGIDLQGILAVIADILTGGELRGASTISQQLARNLYNEQIGRAVTIERKLKEAITAVQLERRYTKREIIEMYLNTVAFGYNAFGIESAAQTFFGKSASELNVLESATLVGMLKGVTLYNPVRNPERSQTRRNVVLLQMVRNGIISRDFYEKNHDKPINAEYYSSELYASMAPYFAEYVRQWMADWTEENGHDLYSDGLRVYTTLDSDLQKIARASVDTQMTALQKVAEFEWSHENETPSFTNLTDYYDLPDHAPFSYFWASKEEVVHDLIRQTDHYEHLRNQGMSEDEALSQLYNSKSFADSLRAEKMRLEAGLVSMDPRNGHVKVWIGGRDFQRDKYDKVAIAKRQPGSTFKPFTYTAAIDNGYSPYYQLLDSTFTWTDPATDSTWSPTNFGGSSGQMLTLSQGLANSKNTVTGRLVLEVGPGAVAFYARRMGIQSELTEVPSIALGTSNVTLLEMTTAYSTLASGGLRHDPIVVTRIEDRYGNVLYQSTPAPQEALSEQTAYTVVDMLRGVIDYGTGQRIRWQFGLGDYDLAGKTGTTQRSADGWFMLMHPELVTGSWVGFNDPRITFRTDFWGQGAHNALLLVGDYFGTAARVDSVGIADAEFPMVDAYASEQTLQDSTVVEDDEGRVGW
jgi:penicillin-binding protein 1A